VASMVTSQLQAVKLSWLESTYSRPGRQLLIGKVDQTDLVFAVQSGFISKSVSRVVNFPEISRNISKSPEVVVTI